MAAAAAAAASPKDLVHILTPLLEVCQSLPKSMAAYWQYVEITHQGGEWVGETPPSQLTLHPHEKDSPAGKNKEEKCKRREKEYSERGFSAFILPPDPGISGAAPLPPSSSLLSLSLLPPHCCESSVVKGARRR